MPDLVLDLLKYVFLVVLYIFVAWAIKAVYLELRPQAGRRAASGPAPAPTPARPPRGSKKAPRKLTIVDGTKKGKSFDLNGELSIGRSDTCDIVLDDSYVSQVHARVFPRGESFAVEDLGSTNGTYLNRRRITAPAELRRGDQIKIGKTVLELRR